MSRRGGGGLLSFLHHRLPLLSWMPHDLPPGQLLFSSRDGPPLHLSTKYNEGLGVIDQHQDVIDLQFFLTFEDD